MYPRTATRIVQAYGVLLGALAMAGAGLFGLMVKNMVDGDVYTMQTYIQVFLLIPTAFMFSYICIGMFKRWEYALSLLTAILYSLVVMILVIMGFLLLQLSIVVVASQEFILFMLALAFLLLSIYVFTVNETVRNLFEKPDSTPVKPTVKS